MISENSLNPKKLYLSNFVSLTISTFMPLAIIRIVSSNAGLESLAQWQFIISLTAISGLLDFGSISSLNNAAFRSSRKNDHQVAIFKLSCVWFIIKNLVTTLIIVTILIHLIPFGNLRISELNIPIKVIVIATLYSVLCLSSAYVEGTLRVAGRLTTGILSLIILRIVDLVVLAVAILFFKSIELWFLCLCLMRLLLLFLFGVYLKSTRFRPVNLDFKQIRSELLFHKWNSTGLVMMTLANYVGVNVSTAFLAATLDSETFAILLSIRMMIGGINQFNRAISNSHYPTIVNYIATNELNEVAKSLSKNIKVNIASSLVFSAILWVFLNPIAKFVVQVEIVRSDFIVLFFASCLFSSMSIPIYLFALAVEKSFPISLGTLIIYCFSLLILHQMSRSLTLDSLSRVVMLTEVSVCLFSYLALHFLRRNLGHNARN